jgi:predicted RNase H-like HicB family nuclease
VVAVTEAGNHFVAVARRSGRWWAVEVTSLPGVFTQARTLDAVEPMVRDAIATFLDLPAASFAIEVRSEPPGEARADVEAALAARAEAERAQTAASAAMRRAVATLAEVGLTNRDAGRLLEVSHQRIAQIAASGPPASEGRRRRRTRHASRPSV